MDLAYASKSPGIGGSIKDQPEDFLVEEITKGGTVLVLDTEQSTPDTEHRTPDTEHRTPDTEHRTPDTSADKPAKFTHFILQKRDWSTSYAIKEIARSLHSSPKRFSYAGMKDKRAITTQLVSAQGIDKKAILGIRVKDIKINGAWYAKDKIRLGSLLGNRFTIRVRDASDDAEERVQKIFNELQGLFPNYFGEQRFGTISRNTHMIGEKIIRGEFESAAKKFLCDHENENHEEARLARQDLAKTQDFKTGLKNYPKHLRFERSMLTHLADNPGDFIGAFMKLPRQILLLFIHAFQSHLFNRLLFDRISEGEVEMEEGEYFCPVTGNGFPDTDKMDLDGFLCMKIIGYSSNPNEREKALLEELGITKERFRIKELPEISSKGTFRTAFAPLVNFSFKNNTFRFSLQSGSYATSALREFIEQK